MSELTNLQKQEVLLIWGSTTGVERSLFAIYAAGLAAQQPAPSGEPVAWMRSYSGGPGIHTVSCGKDAPGAFAVYARPQAPPALSSRVVNAFDRLAARLEGENRADLEVVIGALGCSRELRRLHRDYPAPPASPAAQPEVAVCAQHGENACRVCENAWRDKPQAQPDDELIQRMVDTYLNSKSALISERQPYMHVAMRDVLSVAREGWMPVSTADAAPEAPAELLGVVEAALGGWVEPHSMDSAVKEVAAAATAWFLEQIKETYRSHGRLTLSEFIDALGQHLSPQKPKTPEERVTVVPSVAYPGLFVALLDGVNVCDIEGFRKEHDARRFADGLIVEMKRKADSEVRQ